MKIGRLRYNLGYMVHGHRASSCYSHHGGWSDWAITWPWTYYFWLFGSIFPPFFPLYLEHDLFLKRKLVIYLAKKPRGQ